MFKGIRGEPEAPINSPADNVLSCEATPKPRDGNDSQIFIYFVLQPPTAQYVSSSAVSWLLDSNQKVCVFNESTKMKRYIFTYIVLHSVASVSIHSELGAFQSF